MRKTHFTDQEALGLSPDEKDKAEKWMRANFTSTQCETKDLPSLFEMYMLGYTFPDIQKEFPKYDVRQITMTAALHKWGAQKESMKASIQNRVQQKISKAVMEQVDFLTTLFDVAAIDNLQEMKAYVQDPNNAPKPKMAISSLKEYKEAVDMLSKVLNSINTAATANPSTIPVQKKDTEALLSVTPPKKRGPPSKAELKAKQDEEEIIDIKDLANL